ncbi:hypothetical protein CF68_26020 [Cupriavidus sp. SK-4]|nr:hypothetical protein CF68_26020 [Cupriavidus sp. SK-4]
MVAVFWTVILNIRMREIESDNIAVVTLLRRSVIVIPLHVVVRAVEEQADIDEVMAIRPGASLETQRFGATIVQMIFFLRR